MRSSRTSTWPGSGSKTSRLTSSPTNSPGSTAAHLRRRLVRWQTSHSRLLLSWLPILSERDEVPLDDLAALSIPAICRRIAQVQYRMALDTARSARYLTGKDRQNKLRELAKSSDDLDRMAAEMVRQWDAMEARAR